jgi:uncharacterized membrane protein (UPF0127 family)
MAERVITSAAVAALVTLGTACERGTTASSPSDLTIVPAAGTAGPGIVPSGFERTTVVLTSRDATADPVELDVWYAGTQELRHRGLTGVTDLGGADGMLFAFESVADHRFYMWRTPMALDIHFFDDRAVFVGSERMTPCLDEASSGCARYSAGTDVLTAIEVPAGSLDQHHLNGSWTIGFEPPYDQ